jgi:hypothetical protein
MPKPRARTVDDVRAMLRGRPPEPEPAGDWIAAANYDAMTVPEARALLDRLGEAQRAELLAYERANKNRVNVVNYQPPGTEASD